MMHAPAGEGSIAIEVRMTPEHTAGCSKKTFSAAAAKEQPQAYPLGYVEDCFKARIKLKVFFNIRLERRPHGYYR
jgi:hypothetical protein